MINPNLDVDPKDAHVMGLLHSELVETEEVEDEVQEEAAEVLTEEAPVVEEPEVDVVQLKKSVEDLERQRAGILRDLAAERAKRREFEEKLNPPVVEEAEPDKDIEPVDYLAYKYKKEMEALASQVKALQESLYNQEISAEAERISKEEAEFVTEVADYPDRLNYFRNQSLAILIGEHNMTREQAVATITDAERSVIKMARMQGRRPMELIVEASNNLGYKPGSVTPVTEPVVTKTPAVTVSQVTKATARNKTLTKAEGSAGSDRLTQEDFDKLSHGEQLAIMADSDLARQLENNGYINRASIPRDKPAFLRAV